MEKNNSNQNNGENFLTNINYNFEKNFDYDKEDLSIFQKETNEIILFLYHIIINRYSK